MCLLDPQGVLHCSKSVNTDANQNKRREVESEDPEERHNPTHGITGPPRDRGLPGNFKGHVQESYADICQGQMHDHHVYSGLPPGLVGEQCPEDNAVAQGRNSHQDRVHYDRKYV